MLPGRRRCGGPSVGPEPTEFKTAGWWFGRSIPARSLRQGARATSSSGSAISSLAARKLGRSAERLERVVELLSASPAWLVVGLGCHEPGQVV